MFDSFCKKYFPGGLKPESTYSLFGEKYYG